MSLVFIISSGSDAMSCFSLTCGWLLIVFYSKPCWVARRVLEIFSFHSLVAKAMTSSRDLSMPFVFKEKLLLPYLWGAEPLKSACWCPSVAQCGQWGIAEGKLAQCCIFIWNPECWVSLLRCHYFWSWDKIWRADSLIDIGKTKHVNNCTQNARRQFLENFCASPDT